MLGGLDTLVNARLRDKQLHQRPEPRKNYSLEANSNKTLVNLRKLYTLYV